jgi:hypothetical protein
MKKSRAYVIQRESTLQWSKNVIINIFFKIVHLSISSKSRFLKTFLIYTQNKIVQLSNNAIVRRTMFFY